MGNQRYRLIEHLLFPRWKLGGQRIRKAVTGKTLLITGASYGIGEQLAYRLAPAGCRLLLVARTAEKLDNVKQEVERLGGRAEVFPCDLRDDQQIQQLIQHLLSRENGVDIFVSNAGKSIRRPLLESLDRYHDFERTLALNYQAPVKLCLALLPMLIRRRGQIVNVSAVNTLLLPAPYWAAYQASKTAFDQWCRCATPELHAQGVAVSSVYLPLVRTRMIAPTPAYRKAPAMSPEHVADIICRCIIRRRRAFKPWWLPFGELASVLFRKMGEWGMGVYLGR